MKKLRCIVVIALLLTGSILNAQSKDTDVVAAIVKEATDNSQLEKLAHE